MLEQVHLQKLLRFQVALLGRRLDLALEAREIVKANVLDNNLLGAREVAQTIAARTHAEVVQVIGNRFVLYRKSKKAIIELPK